jgi:hypothetical protein
MSIDDDLIERTAARLRDAQARAGHPLDAALSLAR